MSDKRCTAPATTCRQPTHIHTWPSSAALAATSSLLGATPSTASTPPTVLPTMEHTAQQEGKGWQRWWQVEGSQAARAAEGQTGRRAASRAGAGTRLEGALGSMAQALAGSPRPTWRGGQVLRVPLDGREGGEVHGVATVEVVDARGVGVQPLSIPVVWLVCQGQLWGQHLRNAGCRWGSRGAGPDATCNGR